MYKVFLNENVINLTSEIQFGSNITVLPLKETSINDVISKVKKHKKIYLYHHNSLKLISNFKKKIKVVKAGGGVVTNSKDEILFIFRRNKWDLPKGKMDKGETIENTAVREVEEETGVKNLVISSFFKDTYHIFKKDSKYFLKQTSWFNMNSNYDGELHPELNEGISKVVWKSRSKIKKIKNTFPNIKLLLKKLI
jgi:8-oxo-dGTP pyrophosphatase MutT (NUDIX family)